MKRRFNVFFFCFVFSVMLGGCASHMEGVMLPKPGGIEKNRIISILAVTTRAASQDPRIMFSGQRSSKISFADIGVGIPLQHKTGEVEWPLKHDTNPDKYFTTAHAQTLSNRTFTQLLRKRMQQNHNGRVLVFVHGYNTRFEDAVYRLAQITFDANAKAIPILFTWPSQGKLLGYAYDRESATFSRDGLENLLQQLSRDNSVKDITILAHSMGNMVALDALRQMAVRNRSISPKIRNVLLASPDVDLDVARNLINGMGKNRPHIVLFTSQDDVALKFSARVWGNANRLGTIDATKEPYLSALENQNIKVVDMTAIKTGDPLHHFKLASFPEIVRLLGPSIASGQAMSSRPPGLGDRLGQTVSGVVNTAGNAAVVVLSAPISVVDQDTRRNMSERVETLSPFQSSPQPIAEHGK